MYLLIAKLQMVDSTDFSDELLPFFSQQKQYLNF